MPNEVERIPQIASAVTLAHHIGLLRRQLPLKGKPYRIDFSKNFSKKVDERLKMRYTVYC